MDRPTFIDLFSGAGGLTTGLESEPLLGVDFDKDAVSTLRSAANHDVLQSDIWEFLNRVRSGAIFIKGVHLGVLAASHSAAVRADVVRPPINRSH